MTKEAKPIEQTKDSYLDPKIILQVLSFTIGSRILESFGLPSRVAFLLSSAIVIIAGYWVPPRPKEGFIRHVTFTGSALIGFIIAIEVVPNYFMPFMPKWFAYFLPLLLYSVPLYFLIKKLQPNSRFIRWVIGCIIFAAVLASIFLYIPPSRN